MNSLQSASFALLIGLGAGLSATQIAMAAPCPPASDRVAVGVSPPPPLPAERQPPIPAYGHVWTPGYWGWNSAVNDYYWIPGVWVAPPRIGFLWTPGYWGWSGGIYLFNAGYWGPRVGFYGGIKYGFGYGGFGYRGGFWRGRTFFYNRAVNNLGHARINAVFNQRIIEGRRMSRASFNGGPGGVRAGPRAEELAAGRESHLRPTAAQAAHGQAASMNPSLRAGLNHGRPSTGGPGEARTHAQPAGGHAHSHGVAAHRAHVHASRGHGHQASPANGRSAAGRGGHGGARAAPGHGGGRGPH
jgi:hypothetical protein